MDPVDLVNFSETFENAEKERRFNMLFLTFLFLLVLRQNVTK